MAKLFGFSIEDSQKKSTSIVSPVPKNNEDGVDNYIASGFYGQYVDIEGAYRSEHELIKRYREMAYIQRRTVLSKTLLMKQSSQIYMTHQ